jgi:hypothetical protein
MLKNDLQRKGQMFQQMQYLLFFVVKEPFNDVQQKDFLQNLGLLIVKNNLPLQFVDSVWFKRLLLHLSPRIVLFFLENNFFRKYYLTWWRKRNKYMFCQSLQIVFLPQQSLICGCQRVWMIYLLLLYIFWDLLATQTSNY